MPSDAQSASLTNREVHEQAAGMGLEQAFFTRNGIDPDALATANGDGAVVEALTSIRFPFGSWLLHISVPAIEEDTSATWAVVTEAGARTLLTKIRAGEVPGLYAAERPLEPVNPTLRRLNDDQAKEIAALRAQLAEVTAERALIEGPAGFGNCEALSGLSLFGKVEKCMNTIRSWEVKLRNSENERDAAQSEVARLQTAGENQCDTFMAVGVALGLPSFDWRSEDAPKEWAGKISTVAKARMDRIALLEGLLLDVGNRRDRLLATNSGSNHLRDALYTLGPSIKEWKVSIDAALGGKGE